MKVAVLVGATLVVTAAAVVAAECVLDPGHLFPASVALGVCLPAAMVTLVFTDLVWSRWPDYGPVAVLIGTAVRMVVAVGAVFLLGPVAERSGVSRERLAVWATALYLITLVIESALLVRGALARERRRTTTASTT